MISKNKIIGHNKQLDFLINNFKKKFPHAWIFVGPKGIGKYTSAINFITNIYEDKISFEQNVFQINSNENLALIEDIRALINQVNLTNANSNQKCFVLIDNLDSLNFNSYNALLITIEEPPDNTILILICHNTNVIPKTILSRCIKLRFNPLNKKEIKEFCDINKINIKNFDLENYQSLINGSVEKLLLLSSEEGRLVLNKLNLITNSLKFKITEFEKLYNLISYNFENYYSIIASHLLNKQKIKYLKYFKNKKIIVNILKFFLNIEIFTKQNLNIDNKKVLHYLILEFLKTNKYE